MLTNPDGSQPTPPAFMSVEGANGVGKTTVTRLAVIVATTALIALAEQRVEIAPIIAVPSQPTPLPIYYKIAGSVAEYTHTNWRSALKSGDGMPERLKGKGHLGNAIGFLTDRQRLETILGLHPNFPEDSSLPYWDWLSGYGLDSPPIIGQAPWFNTYYEHEALYRQHEQVYRPGYTKVPWRLVSSDRGSASTIVFQQDPVVHGLIADMYTHRLLRQEDLTTIILPEDVTSWAKARANRTQTAEEYDQHEAQVKAQDEYKRYASLRQVLPSIPFTHSIVCLENDPTGTLRNISTTSFALGVLMYATMLKKFNGFEFLTDGTRMTMQFDNTRVAQRIERGFSDNLQASLNDRSGTIMQCGEFHLHELNPKSVVFSIQKKNFVRET
ncbi:hypothetical protein KC660_03630 [Candidatus Dojkabacteria bacterium]|uniref:Uncharacterized protein n=1 Tax=Candidatus Dojkabacteria bacterium TaxID=2099670 RepID=A0A955RIK3_9BACT|nr:hypothetical protein [Candidatus Dojkabacteria bacterium]